MTVQTLKVAGKDFVIVPKRAFEQMQAKLNALTAEERGDIAEAKRRAKEPSISLENIRKRLGR
jgi:ribosome recycling factor